LRVSTHHRQCNVDRRCVVCQMRMLLSILDEVVTGELRRAVVAIDRASFWSPMRSSSFGLIVDRIVVLGDGM
jgi:hypothetical protein